MKPRPASRLSLPIAAAITALLAAQSAHATSDSWKANVSANWAAAGSWTGGNIPGSTTTDNTDTATFSFTLASTAKSVTVDANRYIGNISFGNTSTLGYTLKTGTLHLNSGGVIQTLSGNGNHTDSITSPLVISGTSAATAFFTAGANSGTSYLAITGGVTGSAAAGQTTTLTLNGTATGANNRVSDIGDGSGGGNLAVVKSGTGTWALDTTGTNTYSGGTTISGGTLIARSSAALSGYNSSGKVVINGGTLQVSLATSNIWSAADVNTLISNATKTSGALALDTNTSTFTESTSVTGIASLGNIGLTKVGTGTLILDQTNSHTGATTLSAGTLQVGNGGSTGSLGSSSGVALAGSTNLTFNRTGNLTFAGNLTGSATSSAVNVTAGLNLTLSGTNSFLGALNVQNGTVSFANWATNLTGNATVFLGGTAALGAGTGTLEYTNTDSPTTNKAINLYTGGTGVLQIDNAATIVNLSLGSGNPQIGGSGNLVKTGLGGLMSSNGKSNYTGTTTIQAGSLIAGNNAPVSAAGAFGNASSAIVLGNGSTGAGDAPALLISGAFTVGRDITVGSVSNSNAYKATIGGSNTTGTSVFSGNITLNTTATNYTATLQAATGGTVEFNTGTWTTNDKPIAIGSAGNAGTVKLSNNITTAGGINVNYGSLVLNSNLTGPVSVAAGATLGGIGSINGTLGMNGILSPGSSIAKLESGALTFYNGSTFAYEMNHSAVLPGDANNLADLQLVHGNLLLSGTVNLTLTDLAVPTGAFAPNTTTLSLIQYVGSWNGGFFTYGGTNLLENNEAFTDTYGNNWKITYNSAVGGLNFATPIEGSHFVTLTNLTAVPEPGSWLALGCLISSGAFMRRRHTKVA